MIALVTAVFVASVLGSLHCAGMCGAFVAFAVGIDGSTDHRRRWNLQAAYNAGRLVTYTLLGVAAGAAGSAFDAAGSAMGMQRAAVLFAGSAMVVFGSAAILRLNGVSLPRAPIPGFMQRGAGAAMRFAVNRQPLARAALTGLSTTLLPCGWLYAFVIVAAGTSSPLFGAATMAAFWLGTLPAVVALGTGVQVLARRLPALGRRIPVISATLIVAVGLFNVFNHGRLDALMRSIRPAPAPEALVSHVSALGSGDAPACHDRSDRP